MKNLSVEKLIQVGYRYVTKSQGRFYLYLAVFCSILVVLDAGSVEVIRGNETENIRCEHETSGAVSEGRS